MRFLQAALIWVLITFMVVPPDLQYEHLQFALTTGSLTGPLILSSVLLVGLVAVGSRYGQARALLRQVNPFLLLFVALATASALWSADPAATARRLFRLYAFLVGCFAFALVGWHRQRFQNVVRPALTVLLAGSILFGLLAPELAIEKSEVNGVTMAELVGAWRGLAMQKNALGEIAAVGTLLWVHALLSREAGLLRVLPGLGVSVACLLLSRSSTSVFATVFAVPFLYLIVRPPAPALRRYTPFLIAVFAGLITLYSLAVLNIIPGLGMILEPITALAGKDMTFSGRTLIWSIIKEQIGLHPWLGIGYGAYWTGAVPQSPSYEFVLRTYVYPTQSHNGYLDLINELGFVGGACLVAYQVAYLRQGLRFWRVDRYQGGLYLAMIFQEFIGNLTEANWLNVASLNFLVLTLATVCMARGPGAPAGGGSPAPRRGGLRPQPLLPRRSR